MKGGLDYRSNPVIYLADDDSDDVYFIKSALHEIDSGLAVRNFSNGQQLLDVLRNDVEVNPVMVILDLNMPTLDGRETLRQVREFAEKNLPVIIFTNSNHQHEKELCFEYGATTFITKPLSYHLYVEMLRKVKEEWLQPAVLAHHLY